MAILLQSHAPSLPLWRGGTAASAGGLYFPQYLELSLEQFFHLPGSGKQMMVCSKGVVVGGGAGGVMKGLFTMKWAGWENQDSDATESSHGEGPLPSLYLKGQRRAGPPQHCALWTGTMGWETARGISALVSLLLPFNLLLLAKSTWKPKATGARSSLPGHRAKWEWWSGHVDCGSG